MIISHIIEVYMMLCASIIFHEAGHLIAAKIIRLAIKDIHIGDSFFSIHVKKLCFSPIMYSSPYVSFYREDLLKKTRKEICFFFLAGPLLNFVLMFIAMLNLKSWYMNILFWINAYLLIENLFPIYKKNDMSRLISYFRQKNSANN